MSDTGPPPEGEPAGGDAAASGGPPERQSGSRPSAEEPDAAEVDVGDSGSDSVAGEAEHAAGAESGAAIDRNDDQLGGGGGERAKVAAGELEEGEEERARLVREAELERMRNTEKMHQSLASRRETSFEELEEAETKRRQQLADRFILTETYWERMKWHLEAGKMVNKALVAHFGEVAVAHKAYAAALSKMNRLSKAAEAYGPASAPGAAADVAQPSRSANSLATALVRLAGATTAFGRKVDEFGAMVKRDLVDENLRALSKSFAAEAKRIEARGASLTAAMVHASKEAVSTHGEFRRCFVEKPSGAAAGGDGGDLWLLELRYKAASEELDRAGKAYLKGMADLFVEVETLERRRSAVLSNVLSALLHRTRTLWEGHERDVGRVIKAVDGVDVNADLAVSVRHGAGAPAEAVAKAATATVRAAGLEMPRAAGSGGSEGAGADDAGFPRAPSALAPMQARAPLQSVLIVRSAELRRRSGMLRTWQVHTGVLTCDARLHVFEEGALRRGSLILAKSAPALSLDLRRCRLQFAPHVDEAAFELVASSEGVLWSSTKTHTLKCDSQEGMVDWMVALQQFVPKA